MEEQLKKQIEDLKKENAELRKGSGNTTALEATVKELYAALGSKRPNIKVIQKKNGVPIMLKVTGTKETDNGTFIEVSE